MATSTMTRLTSGKESFEYRSTRYFRTWNPADSSRLRIVFMVWGVIRLWRASSALDRPGCACNSASVANWGVVTPVGSSARSI